MEKTKEPKASGPDKDCCILENRSYPELSQVCAKEICMICERGEWVELSWWPEDRESDDEDKLHI